MKHRTSILALNESTIKRANRTMVADVYIKTSCLKVLEEMD